MNDTGNTFWRDMLSATSTFFTCGIDFGANWGANATSMPVIGNGAPRRSRPSLRLIVNEHAPADRPPVSDRRSHLRLIRGGRL